MTQKEIDKFLDNTKVYVNGKSKEIQEKLFSFGYKWDRSNSTDVHNTDKPFLFIGNNRDITYAINMDFFVEHENKEITAEQILALELTEPSYRPFKDAEECWQEMLKHEPFGWVCCKYKYRQVLVVADDEIRFADLFLTFDQAVNDTFPDGTPFGIEE